MDKILQRDLPLVKIFLSFLLIVLSFLAFSSGLGNSWFSYFWLVFGGSLAFFISFGKNTVNLFDKPVHKPVKVYFKILIITFSYSMIIGLIEQYIFGKGSISSNASIAHVPWEFPFMILGEELVSLYIFLALWNKLKNLKYGYWIATVSSGLIFGLAHIPTYMAQSLPIAILHVMILMGVNRIIFNISYSKTKSIWVPFLIHISFDTILIILTQLPHIPIK
ncbi:CPBP family intramembrane glutamic endopeptidase [Carnobacterium maltaromaticum]|uniref:CPBP family intramembrane glutamic endopeptidase n=1 Tax=Carnobacterium maltaromaticum TaxID=2751 RepID=UPI0010726230|nr:CPBP family intramembrane glutamic endopeptidase [Carnobacterium maltaromaticum]TFJ77647.1 hypothetical protein CKN94_00010 [Carnobacterium maltaromaticum]TFJ79712.1 hypothetical protein CKN97_00010 [Carnobacterium maltaromaticum]